MTSLTFRHCRQRRRLILQRLRNRSHETQTLFETVYAWPQTFVCLQRTISIAVVPTFATGIVSHERNYLARGNFLREMIVKHRLALRQQFFVLLFGIAITVGWREKILLVLFSVVVLPSIIGSVRTDLGNELAPRRQTLQHPLESNSGIAMGCLLHQFEGRHGTHLRQSIGDVIAPAQNASLDEETHAGSRTGDLLVGEGA
mmetsp:Transcript_1997/g.4718  ORF Transcript_1997/g.4718 Transcript_1997/m.4718 type:complete len:201 (+) Transcript_1997:1681-2283(+)